MDKENRRHNGKETKDFRTSSASPGRMEGKGTNSRRPAENASKPEKETVAADGRKLIARCDSRGHKEEGEKEES